MPRLSPPERNPLAVPLAIVGLFLVAGTSFWLGRWSVERDLEELRELRQAPPAAEEVVAHGDDVAPREAEAAEPPASDAHEARAQAAAPREEPSPAPSVAAPSVAAAAPSQAARPADRRPSRADGLHDLSTTIRGSVTRTLVQKLGRKVGDPLSQVTGRLLVWWVDPTRDLRKGDALRLVYELPEGSEPVVHALSFTSQKLGRTFEAFRFQPAGAPFARYYDRDGKEIEMRLERSPMASYEQITSLLRDGRGHAGVDFKAPVGLPVSTPFAGKVTRTNFNTRINGNCVEIEDAKGRRILFLHLSELAAGVRPGASVRQGQQVGLSGNPGRSTAPHLHYQIMSRAGRVLDPFQVHPTYRVSLDPAQLPAFREAVRGYEGRLQLVAGAD